MEINFENICLAVVIICFIVGIPALIYVLYKYIKERRERIKRILTEVKPIEVNLYDVLIYEYSNGEDTMKAFCPVLKEISSGKLYVRKPKGDLGNIDIIWHIIYKDSPIEIKSKKGKQIDSNMKGYLYVDTKESLVINDNKLNLLNGEYEYKGNMKDMKSFQSVNKIYSMNSENILEELKDAYVFEGIVEFDADAPIKL